MLPGGTQQPGGRAPAPEPLLVVQRFVNTVDLDEPDGDRLRTLDEMRAWLREVGLPSADLREHDRLVAVRLREHLRDSAEQGTGTLSAEIGATLDELRLTATLEDGRLVLTSTTPLGRSLAAIVDAVRTGMDDGTWARCKVCSRHSCRWFFYDHSKNHAGRWCATSVCGSREKSLRAYRRRTGATA